MAKETFLRLEISFICVDSVRKIFYETLKSILFVVAIVLATGTTVRIIALQICTSTKSLREAPVKRS
jgi:hypothetical protein